MENLKRKKRRGAVLSVLIVFVIVMSTTFSFAWFTDNAESSLSDFKFGNIALDITGSSVGDEGNIVLNVQRKNIEYQANEKLMPGDTVSVDIDVGLTQNSENAYYLVKLTDSYGIFDEAYYFADGTTDDNGELIVYYSYGTGTSWEQATKTVTTKKVGVISNTSTHSMSLSAKISEDFEDNTAKTKVECDILAIQQANLTEDEAYNYLMTPFEYTFVDWVAGNGTQYIDTGVTLKQSIRPYIDFQSDTLGRTGGRNGYVLFGAKDETNNIVITVNYGAGEGQNTIFMWHGKTLGGGNVVCKCASSLDRTVLYVDTDYIWYENTVKRGTQRATTGTSETTIHLWSINYGDGVAPRIFDVGTLKVYSFKLYDGETLIRNFIPCVRKEDGVAGMFDTVQQKFYENNGTGDFVWGYDS